MPKNLVIVESPAKAKTLKKFLGANYKIEASVGHVRDLPKSELGVDINNDFEPKYITIRGKGEVLAKLRKEVKTAEKVYLATDPDREGEAISWHLMHALKLDPKKTYRITFNEITKSAVKDSIKNAGSIDMSLVDAQQARRSLDRIVGYKIGPLLWKKVKKGLSAGRVQSVGLKIICDRETEIEQFITEEYWTCDAVFKEKFSARLTAVNGVKFEPKSKEEIENALKPLKAAKYTVTDIKKGKRAKKPNPPFITSTLQQEASKVLGYTTSKTMRIAQQLYEGVDIAGLGTTGLITYLRTDSFRISDEAYEAASLFIKEQYGKEYLPASRNTYLSKKNAQDAHEAIRPSYANQTPESLKNDLSKEQYKLYKLIWERFIASQMCAAEFDTVQLKVEANGFVFRASGSVLKKDGYLLVYKKNETDEKEEGAYLPELKIGAVLNIKELHNAQHFTQPPPRYNEATLVKTLEEQGIGRPSTYAAVISILTGRGYVAREAKTLVPTELGLIVNEIMEKNFPQIIDVDFTANMEAELDKVEEGEVEWKAVLREFYPPFEKDIIKADEAIGEIELKPEETDVICDKCGRNMVIKIGRFGKFLACPGFPECRNAKPFFENAGVSCPLCQADVFIKKTKKGRRYYGCANNPDCAFMTWAKPTGEKCPVCGEPLVIKQAKTPKAVCSSQNCAFSKEAEIADE